MLELLLLLLLLYYIVIYSCLFIFIINLFDWTGLSCVMLAYCIDIIIINM